MGDQEEEVLVSLDVQFLNFAATRNLELEKRDGSTIDLYRIDFWLRQARMLNDRDITMTDTGIVFFRFNKSEINIEEFREFLKELSDLKNLNLEEMESSICKCGFPGALPVKVPQYRDYFLTWKPKNQLIHKKI